MIAQDLRYTFRALLKSPAFTVAAVLTLALGIGANATMFGIVDLLLLRPPAHVRDPQGVARIGVEWRARQSGESSEPSFFFSFPAYRALRGASGFEGIGLMTTPQDFPVGRGRDAARAAGVLVSANYFSLLGVTPHHGRFFTADEGSEPVGAPVAVISYGFWQREMAGDPSAIGREVRIGTRPYTIVGIAPRAFTGLWLGATDIWIPLSAAEGLRFVSSNWTEDRQSTWLHIFGRLRTGVSPSQAAEQAAPLFRSTVDERRLANYDAAIVVQRVRAAVASGRSGAQGDLRIAVILAGVAGLVLLIACTNVANLMLARALGRRREIALRLALGIKRRRLVAQLLTESITIALVGGAAAIVMARWGGEALRVIFFGDVVWTGSVVDGRLLLFAAVATLVTALLAGLLPALQASRVELAAALKTGSKAGARTIHGARTRAALLTVQATLATVLLTGTGLFVQSLRKISEVPLGMAPEGVLMASIGSRGTGYATDQLNDVYERMAEAVRSVPGVQSAAVSLTVPFASSWGSSIRIPGRDSVPGAYINAVSPGFFETMGTPILSGRDFSRQDSESGNAIVVSARAATSWWPSESALGQCVVVGPEDASCMQVIGVAQDMRKETVIEPEENVLQVYVPLSRATSGMSQRLLLVRGTGRAVTPLIGPVRSAVQGSVPDLPYVNVRPLAILLEREIRPWRLGASMFSTFGALALLLTCVGIYGVVAYTVTHRTHEFGVRVALGAQKRSILSRVAGEGVQIALIGAGAGVLVALAFTRLIEPLLFEVSPRDPMVVLGVVLIIVVAAVLGSLIPAWRAARVDPMVALRSD